MRYLPLSAIVISAAFTAGFSLPETSSQHKEFRPHMQSVYASVVQVMPLFLQGDTKATPKEKAAMEIQFKNLAEQSRTIRDLAMKSDAGHKALASELAVSSESAYTQFKQGHENQARFFLSDVVNTCFGCHTSRGSTGDSQFVANFNKDVKWESFEPLARARFLALSRQFDSALKEYETMFKASMSEDDMVNLDPFVEYMVLGLRVQNSFDRVLDTMSRVKTNEFPELVKKDIRTWVATLKDVKKENIKTNTLAEAKTQLNLAKQSMEYPQDRSGLVRTIIATRILKEVLNDKTLSVADRAEAYYQLGLAENVIGNDFFGGESLAYFEETVKLAPKTEVSKKAYAQLEEILRFHYSGSGGTHLPENEKSRLRDLKKMAF